jgi:predicted dienelactone hydrolase
MRALFLAAALLLACPISMAFGETEPFHAGIARLSIDADVPLDVRPFDILVWYPTEAAEAPWQAGPFPIPASHDAEIAPGRFPLVLLSHGGSVKGGNPLVLRELSADLARQGFVVVAPFHGTAGMPVRPLQIKLALDAILADPRFSAHADPARLGMLGFSLGGAVTLELAGAVPNMAHLGSYCGAHPDDVLSCDQAPGGGSGAGPRQNRPPGSPPSPLPLKAIVLLDPFAVPFQHDELVAVTVPVLLFRPAQSELSGEGNAIGLAAALPHPPHYETVPGGHFIFVDVCTPFLQSAAPEACRDPPDVDRAAVHAGIEAQVAAFFRSNL